MQTRIFLPEWIKKILSDTHSAIIAVLVGSFALPLFFVHKKNLWSVLKNTLQAETPLWATIALVFLLGLYIFLKVQTLSSTTPNYNGINNFHREQIHKWRKMVNKAIKEQDLTEKTATEILERDANFYSLRPYLSKKTIGSLASCRTTIVGSTIDTCFVYILDDIEALEKQWKVSSDEE